MRRRVLVGQRLRVEAVAHEARDVVRVLRHEGAREGERRVRRRIGEESRPVA